MGNSWEVKQQQCFSQPLSRVFTTTAKNFTFTHTDGTLAGEEKYISKGKSAINYHDHEGRGLSMSSSTSEYKFSYLSVTEH